MGYLGREEIIPNSALAIYNATPWLFAVVSSKMHVVWVRATAGRLEERIRYSASICYNNFPLPRLESRQRDALGELAHRILAAREAHFPKSVADLYDPKDMPEDLRAAHSETDLAVERCYRSKPFSSDEERLEYLFDLYQRLDRSATTAEPPRDSENLTPEPTCQT